MSDSKSSEPDFEVLRFIRVFTPMHIPKHLVEQVRDRDWEVDDWFKYQEIICLRQSPEGLQLNPLSMLYVIADENNKVVGMLWCEVSPLSKSLIVQNFSMDKAYWCKGKAVHLLAKKAKEICRECKLKKILWSTTYPKHSERYGFKRSKTVLMEYTPEEENGKNIHGGESACRESTDADSRTTTVSVSCPGGDRTSSGSIIPTVSPALPAGAV